MLDVLHETDGSIAFDGARSIGMPSVQAVYVVKPYKVVVHEAEFRKAAHLYADRA